MPDYANGKAYLTTHRVIYVDSTKPQTHSVSLDLKLVKAREYFVCLLPCYIDSECGLSLITFSYYLYIEHYTVLLAHAFSSQDTIR